MQVSVSGFFACQTDSLSEAASGFSSVQRRRADVPDTNIPASSVRRTLPHPDAQVFTRRYNIDILESILQLKLALYLYGALPPKVDELRLAPVEPAVGTRGHVLEDRRDVHMHPLSREFLHAIIHTSRLTYITRVGASVCKLRRCVVTKVSMHVVAWAHVHPQASNITDQRQ